MNQNPTVDNDLQKAIDDITNSTNQDPVFADPVAAPSSVPDGDDGTLAEPVGPFPEPKPMPKTADERSPLAPIAGGTAVIGISALLHLLIKERNKLKMIQSQLEKTEEVEEHISLGR